LEVSLRWRALEAPRTTYTVFLHLIGPDGERVAQRDELLLQGYYQPTVWPQDRAVVDRHVLSLPADLAPGRYRLEMGLYSPEDQETILPSSDGGDRVVLDYLPTGGTEVAAPTAPLDAVLGGEVRLTGYTLDCKPKDARCNLRLYWQAMTLLDVDYTVLVHLVGKDGRIVGQHDGMPEAGAYPTSGWKPGEIVVDEHRFEIAADAPPGDYQLLAGLYQLETGERLPVLDVGGQPVGDAVLLTTIAIPMEP
jgi:hypothetical protein